jgi:serine phosphatase RsbU (regulator of sigma subunit)
LGGSAFGYTVVLHDSSVRSDWRLSFDGEGIMSFAGGDTMMNLAQVTDRDFLDPRIEAETALRAYQKWIARGRPIGTQLQDWQEAKAEVWERLEMNRQLTAVEKLLITEHAISRTLAAFRTLNEAAPRIIRTLCESLGCDCGVMWVVDRHDNVLRCVAVWHTPNVDVSAFEKDTRYRTFSPDVGIPGRVWAVSAIVWVCDVTTVAPSLRTQLASEAGLHGVVAIPIRLGTEFLGVIEFLSCEVRQPDEELVEMMNSVGSQIGQFIKRIQSEDELYRKEAERHTAQQIQQGLLPKSMPKLNGFSINAWLSNADEVGGDCFDFIPLLVDGKECLIALVADVCGHGIASALLMAETLAYLRAIVHTGADLRSLLTLTNRLLIDGGLSDNFITLLAVQLDLHTRSLRHSSAGHCPGYVLDRKGRTKLVLGGTDLPLGINSNSKFPVGPTVFLESGDLAFLYTDGIVEATSPNDELFGLERALDIVRMHQQEPPNAILEAIFDAVGDFSRCHIQDDMTAIVIKVEPADSVSAVSCVSE